MEVLQNYCCNECSPHLINVVTLPCKIKCSLYYAYTQLENVQENNCSLQTSNSPDLKLVDYNLLEILLEEVY